MFLIGVGLGLTICGVMLYFITYMFPIFRMVYLDWIALFIMLTPWFMTMYRMNVTQSTKQTDKLPKFKTLVNYIKRDLDVIPVVGERAFPGQSFLLVPYLGLIEHMGKDSVLRWGDKKTVLALENCYDTPDPHMLDASQTLHELGFNDRYSLAKLLIGKNLNYNDLKLMAEVFINMERYDNNHGVKRLVNEWSDTTRKNVVFKPKPKVWSMKNGLDVHRQIDEVIKKQA